MRIKKFHATDTGSAGGLVLEATPNRLRKIYKTSQGKIASIAFSRAGDLYFVLQGGRSIYQLKRTRGFSFPTRVYTHARPIAGIGFSPDGALHLSMVSRRNRQGTLIHLRGQSIFHHPSPVQTISSTQVGGRWTGHFCFDQQRRLIISVERNGPGRIYRLSPNRTELLHQAKTGAILGLANLHSDQICFVTGNASVRMLDPHARRLRTVYSNRTGQRFTDIALTMPTVLSRAPSIEVDTRYQGAKEYRSTARVFQRSDLSRHTVFTEFIDMDANTPDIQALLADIGVPTNPTENDQEIWYRTRMVWAWLFRKGMRASDSHFEAAKTAMYAEGSPHIAIYGSVFARYGGFPWYSDCTCVCRSLLLITLLYRVGLSPDQIALAETTLRPETEGVTHHTYVVLRIGDHWYSLDPTELYPELPLTPTDMHQLPQNFPDTPDYDFPFRLMPLPGAELTKPFWVR